MTGARVGKYNLGTKTGNEFFSVRVGKHTLGARVGKYKLEARSRVRRQAKSRGPGKTNTPCFYVKSLTEKIHLLNN